MSLFRPRLTLINLLCLALPTVALFTGEYISTAACAQSASETQSAPALDTKSTKTSTTSQPAATSPSTLCDIYITSTIDSSKAKVDDKVLAVLKQSLLVSPTYNAAPGSRIIGHIISIADKRTLAKAVVSSHRRFSQDDAIGVVFQELDCPDGARFKINARLAKQKYKVPLANGHQRAIAVNKDGQIIHSHEVLRTPIKIRNYVGQYLLQAATVTIGIFTAGLGAAAVPAVMGAAGAANPSFVTNAPVDPEERHPRAQGFAWGAVNAIPGSSIVEAFVCKGDNAAVLPGDQFTAAFGPLPPETICTKIATAKIYNNNSSTPTASSKH